MCIRDRRTEILTKPYPGFATDVQQPFTVLLTQCEGQSVVTETIYTCLLYTSRCV